MLAATFFSLLLPAIRDGEAQFGSRMLAVSVAIVGLLAGAAVLFLLHRCLPHEHFHAGHEGPDAHTLKRIWLFVIAITLHNFPEGMAVRASPAAISATVRRWRPVSASRISPRGWPSPYR
jgi:ZIP family zinc transporter